MHHTPQDWGLLEMIEPPLLVRRVNQGSLMRSIHLGRALFQYYAPFVRSIDVTRTEYRLPPLAYPTLRNYEIIPSVALHELRTLSHRSFIDGDTFIE